MRGRGADHDQDRDQFSGAFNPRRTRARDRRQPGPRRGSFRRAGLSPGARAGHGLPSPSASSEPELRQLTLETATVRVAAFPEGRRLLTVLATCFGPAGACASARLVPRRHAEAPEDGLWDIDLVCAPESPDEDTVASRDVVFTGEADWCEGVRLHSPGSVLEQRLAPHSVGRPPRQVPESQERSAAEAPLMGTPALWRQ